MASICTTHLFMVFVFLLLDTKVSCSSCDAVSYTQRQPCHFDNRRSCERNNCCWDDSDSQTHCFHKECHCSDLVGPCVNNGVKALCSSCQEGWAGDSCDIEIPRLSQRPVATGYTLRTISIRWKKWRKSDPGDGPVESYQVYHRPIITDDNEAPWLTQSTKSNHFTFTDLEPATNYEFAVYPVYRNIMGYRSETIQKATCSAPLQEPRGLALKALQSAHHSELIVQAKWKSLLRSHFGCHRIQHYNIYYTTNGAQNLLLMNNTASTNYVITHVNLYDNFTFGVSAVNSANLEGPRSVVNLHGRSHSVEGLSIGSSTFSEITLSWEPPLQTNGALLEYEIQYRLRSVGGCEATSAEFSDPISVDPRRHFYTLRNIYPYTVYVVRVRAITAAGEGKVSEITANTLSRAPNSTITTVHVIRMSKRSATLDWESPDCNLRYGKLISYRYELHHVYNDTTHSRVVSRFTNETDVTFTDLVPNNLYSFSVAFMTDHGQSSMSNAVQFSTHPDVPPAVTGIHVLAYSSSLFIEWRKPTPNHGELTAYELKYTDANTQQYTQVHLSPQQTTHSIEALKQDTTYLIQVRACNVVGCGQWSRIINKHTSPAVPEAPVNFTNTTRTANSIRFSWEPPLRNDGEIISYKISCQSSLSLRNSEFVISPTQYYVNVERLKPNTLYICTLHAVSQHGSGTNVQISAYTLPQVQGQFEAPVLDSSKSTDETLTVVLSPRNINRLQNIDRQKDNDIYYIIIESISLQNRLRRSAGQSPCDLDHTELVTLNYNLAMTLHSRCYVAAALNDLGKGQEFTVGDNVTYNGFYNAPLVKGQEYNVWVAAIASGDGVVVAAYRKTELSAVASQSLSQSSPVTKQSFALTGIIIAIVVVVALVVIVLVIVVFRRRHFSQSSIVIVDKHNSSKSPFEHTDTSDMHHTSPQYSHIYDDYQRQGNCDHSDIVHQQGIELDESDDLVYSDNELKPLYSSPKSETVVVQDLWSYVQKGEADKLNQQYQALPSGLHSPCTMALLPQNKVKNRYGNIIAYDHSRVKLIHAHGDTDYINANYIDGYNNPDAFIAAQGPSRYTISDMWLMIWQQNSTRIVMVTNLVENTMLKCETYWPQAGTAKYGEIKVTLLNMEELAMYTIRTFQMEQGSDSKIVRQFHFTSWPDHGVPKHATSLINFRRKVRSFDDNKGPIVVHCSAGVGRTGTFIGLDYLLDCAEATGKVNVFDCVNYMRQQRVNMVQTIEQYEFVYKALVEAVKCGDTSIHSVDIHEQYDDVCSINSVTGKRKLIEQFELLDLLSPSPESTFHLAVTSQNIDKNRNTNIIPLDGNNCVYLQTFIPGLSNYINAVFIDGYLHTDSFIATQMPLQETVVSFWCMIYDHKCKTIVMCNQFDQSLDSCYWPDQGERCNFGPFIVQLLALDQTQPDITIRDLQLTYDKELNGTFVVRHFEYHAWVENALIPSDTGTIINLLQCVEKWQQQSGNSKIVVHCLDGASQSGLFIAASHLIERLKLEREVDVFQSCKQIRINRPQFVPNMAQYQYLYEIAIEYIDGFEIYSNFK